MAMAAAMRRRDLNRNHYRCKVCGKWHVGTSGHEMPVGYTGLVRPEKR
jgi:hypothetical protein